MKWILLLLFLSQSVLAHAEPICSTDCDGNGDSYSYSNRDDSGDGNGDAYSYDTRDNIDRSTVVDGNRNDGNGDDYSYSSRDDSTDPAPNAGSPAPNGN